jgi:hypothetical protein
MPSATVCHRTGVDALRQIAAELADRLAAAPEALDGRRLGRSDCDTACDRAAALGAAVKAERDACWLRFAELRGEYEAFLSSLADSLLVSVHDSLPLPLAASAHAASAAAQVQSPNCP